MAVIPLSLSRLLMLHAALSVFLILIAGLWFWRGRPGDPRRPIIFFALLTVIFFPLLGIPAAILIFFGARNSNQQQDIELESQGSHLDKQALRELRMDTYLGLMRHLREETTFEPLIDIMTGHETPLKIKAIRKLTQQFTPEHLALLKAATRDASAEIRLYAATALLKMEDGIVARISNAEKMTQRTKQALDYSTLGDLLCLYSESGLLEPSMARPALNRAAEAYANSLDLETRQAEIMLNYARVLIRLGDFHKARTVLDGAVKMWPGRAEAILLRASVYFELGHYLDVTAQLQAVGAAPLQVSDKEVVSFWTSAA